MKTSSDCSVIVSCALMLALLSGRILMGVSLHEKTITMTVAHVPDSGLRVVSQNGAISVKASDREDVKIVAQLRMRSVERLEATRITTSRDSSDRLEIEVAWPEGGRLNNEGCSFTITLPDATGVELRTENGRITVAGLSGAARLLTSNGRIHVDGHQGDVLARTSNGSISVGEPEGDLDLHTKNGKINVVAAKRAVKAETSNGAVHIHFTDEGTGPVDVHTSNGAITLEMGAGFKGELQADNSNGRIKVKVPSDAQVLSSEKHHSHLLFGDSDNQSRLRTSNGSIEIRRDP